MRKTLIAVAVLSTLGSASHVMAQEAAAAAPASPLSFNVGLASEYSYRGISQSDNKGALSGGADYAHSSGAYVGAWASTISWLEDFGLYSSSAVEVDLYGGFKKELAADTLLDVGVLRYQYPGTMVAGTTNANTTEVYAALNYKTYGVKYSRSVSNLFGTPDSKGSGYLDLYANVDIPLGMQLNLHYGKQTVANNSGFDYSDIKVGVTKDFGFAVGALAYIKTSGNGTDASKGTLAEDWYKGRAVATLTKAF